MSVTEAINQGLPPHALKDGGRSILPNAGSKYAVKLRPKESNNHDGPIRNRTVLCIDGGGMRGIVAASVAVQVETAIKNRIKDKLNELQKNPEDAFKHYELVYQEITADGVMKDTCGPATKDEMLETIRKLLQVEEDIVVHLADYFDVMAGTSTGSILASYFATKGGTAHKHLLKKANAMKIQQAAWYQKMVNSTPGYVLTAPLRLAFWAGTGAVRAVTGSEPTFDEMMVNGHAPERLGDFLECQKDKQFSHLTPGSAQSAQAVMVTAGEIIFGEPRKGLEKVGRTILDIAKAKYSDKPISAVLQQSLGGVGEKAIKFKPCDKCDGKLHSSLLITTLQMDKNRGVIFWGTPHTWQEQHQLHGYAVVHRSPDAQDIIDKKGCVHTEQPATPTNVDTPGSYWSLEHWSKALGCTRSPVKAHVPSVASKLEYTQRGALTVVLNTPNYELWQVVRASTAAPTFFPAQQIKLQEEFEGTFVDGGMVANNPIQQALAFALMLEEEKDVDRGIQAVALQHTAVLSIGCGQAVAPINLGKDAGQLAWATQLVNVLMGPAQDTATATSSHILNMFMRQLAPSNDDRSSRLLRVQGTMFANCANPENNDKLYVERCNDDGVWTMEASKEKWENSSDASKALKALQTMDDASDWKTLLEIGQKIGQAYENDINEWVKDFVLPDNDPSRSCAVACKSIARTGKTEAQAIKIATAEASERNSSQDWRISTAVQAVPAV